MHSASTSMRRDHLTHGSAIPAFHCQRDKMNTRWCWQGAVQSDSSAAVMHPGGAHI